MYVKKIQSTLSEVSKNVIGKFRPVEADPNYSEPKRLHTWVKKHFRDCGKSNSVIHVCFLRDATDLVQVEEGEFAEKIGSQIL